MATFELPPAGPTEVRSFASASHRPHEIGRAQESYGTPDLYRQARLALLGVFLLATLVIVLGAATQHELVMVAGAPFVLLALVTGAVLRNRESAARVCVDVCENGLRLTRGTREYERRQEEIFWLDITRLQVRESESPDDGELLAARLSHGADRATGLPARIAGLPRLVKRIEREVADVAAARAQEKRLRADESRSRELGQNE
jgi:hypothetical protein